MKKFYCQNCGEEVPIDADHCQKCGKEFASILCPECGYSGASNKFENGCPKCGYLSNNPGHTVRKKLVKRKPLTLRIFLTLFCLLFITIILLIKQF